MKDEKKRFLKYELGLLTLKAGLATRDTNYPVYKKGLKDSQKTNAKKEFRRLLVEIEEKYLHDVSEIEHITFISDTAQLLTSRLGHILHNDVFRVGVAQKIINLHLKYLWVSEFICEPLHCPIDGIIRDMAGLDYNWTMSNSLEEYKVAISSLKQLSQEQNLSVAQWELIEFRRKTQ